MSVVRKDLAAFGRKYRMGADPAEMSDDRLAEETLARLSSAGPPSLADYLENLKDPTPSDRNAAAHAAAREWCDKVMGARRLFLQFYHHNRGMTAMSAASVGNAGRLVGEMGATAEQVPAPTLVR